MSSNSVYMTVTLLDTPDDQDLPDSFDDCMARRSRLEVYNQVLRRVEYCYSGTFTSVCWPDAEDNVVECRPAVPSDGDFSPVYAFNSGSPL